MVSTGDVQRLFLQAVVSRGMLSLAVAQILLEKCVAAVRAVDPSVDVPHIATKDTWDTFVATLNRSLDTLDLEFRYLHDETSGVEMYALVNRKGDAIAQIATEYTAAEIAYFKAIIDLIMTAPNESFSVSSLAALREIQAIKPKTNMTKTQAEVVLASFVAKNWLLKSKRGRYSLSTRTMLELLPYLKAKYQDDILECTICFEILTRGVACFTPNCKTRLHFHCFTTFRRRQDSCPSCRTRWPETADQHPLVPVGEGASKGDEVRGTRRQRSPTISDGDEDEGFISDNELQGKTPRRSQRKGKGKESQNMQVESDDDFEV